MANLRFGRIASSAEYRIDEKFQNWQFLESHFDFSNWKNSTNLLIFQFGQFLKFAIGKIPKIFRLENSKNLQFWNLQEFLIWKIQKFTILEIPTIFNSENFKKFQFGKFEKFAILKIQKLPIWKIPKMFNLGISKYFQFGKLKKFSIWQVPKTSNLRNFKN